MRQVLDSILFRSHLDLAHQYIQRLLKNIHTPICIDATCGNGHDSLMMANHSLPHGKLYCFDIQELAISNTKTLLEKNLEPECLGNIHYYLESHENLQLKVSKADLIVYNLGYLPKGDKNLTTKTPITLNSAIHSLSIINPLGALLITCYPGHEEGALEEKALIEWSQTLDPKIYMICYHAWLNRRQAPSLLLIQKMF